ncbi:hypothetical protein EMIT0P253_50263 [Pseudomonas sp. IT-P253]
MRGLRTSVFKSGENFDPPCPQYQVSTHARNGWKVLTGQGDAVIDPYPEKTEKSNGIKQAETSSPSSKK